MSKVIKIWLDDIRESPLGYSVCHSVNQCKKFILESEKLGLEIYLDIDHDLGDFAKDGGDGIELVKWLIETRRFYPITFHTMNPVGLYNMESLVKRYWKQGNRYWEGKTDC